MRLTIKQLAAKLGTDWNGANTILQLLAKQRLASRVGFEHNGPHRPTHIWELPDAITINLDTGVVQASAST